MHVSPEPHKLSQYQHNGEISAFTQHRATTKKLLDSNNEDDDPLRSSISTAPLSYHKVN